MTQVHELYQRMILDHGRKPRNFRALAGEVWTAEQRNVTCGDRIVIAIEPCGDRIHDIAFQGSGCAISMASASMMTEAVKGQSRAAALQLRERVIALLRQGCDSLPNPALAERAPLAELGDLAVLGGVARFPVRIGCAVLAWLVLGDALDPPRAP